MADNPFHFFPTKYQQWINIAPTTLIIRRKLTRKREILFHITPKQSSLFVGLVKVHPLDNMNTSTSIPGVGEVSFTMRHRGL